MAGIAIAVVVVTWLLILLAVYLQACDRSEILKAVRDRGCTTIELPTAELRSFEPAITPDECKARIEALEAFASHLQMGAAVELAVMVHSDVPQASYSQHQEATLMVKPLGKRHASRPDR